MKILVAGDLLPYDRVANLFDQGKYEKVFGQIRDFIKQTDYSIANFECPICKGGEKPIKKCGPSHYCGESVIGAIQYAGFDCVTLANNHFRDFGDEGCLNTMRELENNGIDHVGGGKNVEDAANILYREIEGSLIAIISCCEHEFSIAEENHAGSNPLNPIKQYYAIKEAREKADFVVVIAHGGHEHYQLPSPRMVETYRFFVDAGADAVVNHHQHCFSGYEIYKGKPIFYGLGNFCFDKPVKRADKWNEGYVVELTLTEGASGFELIPYSQCDSEPVVAPLSGEKKRQFFLRINALNEIISNSRELEGEFEKWCQSKHAQKESLFSPYTGTFLQVLYSKGLLRNPISDKRKLSLTDHIVCESHRDVTLYFLHTKS